MRYSIKKVVSETINKSPELERLYGELLDFRKLMLCYRLVHYEDELSNIKISLINRDEELSYPLLQLFYGTEAFEEIKTALEFFINQRRERRQRSLEAALYPILKDLVTNDPNPIVDVLYSLIWTKITEGDNKIKGDKMSATQYETLEYGSIYQNTLSKFIGDKFSASMKHKEVGSILSFDKQKFESYDDIYNHQVKGLEKDVKIDVELIEDPDGTEGMTAFSNAFDKYNDGSREEKENSNPSLEPSGRQSPQPIVFIKCPHCKFENIHQDVIDHHIKYGHESA